METAPASTTSAAPASAPGASSAEPTAPAATASNPPVNVNGSGTPGTSSGKTEPTGSWVDSFDPDLKEYVTQKGFQDPKSVLQSYRNLEKLRGVPEDRLLKLPEQADDKSWNDVYSKLGKPESPEGYGLQPTDPKKPEFTNWAKDTFHKHNLTTAQGQAIVKEFNDYVTGVETQEAEAHKENVKSQMAGLQKEWGAAYQQNVSRAQQAFRQFGIPDQAIDVLEKHIGFDGVMKMFHKLGTSIGEHEFISNPNANFGDGNLVLTPDQARARIKALKQDSEWASRYLKGDVKARKEMENLQKMANPTD